MTFQVVLSSAHGERKCYRCGDCGEWFRYARELVFHMIDCRGGER